MKIQFYGAAEEVTGSCMLISVGKRRILLDCGLFQGSKTDEARNSQPFPFNPAHIDAVILSHAHIDHSGRLPLLMKSGFKGPIYTHRASRELCNILLQDSAYLNEKDAEIENRKRQRKGLKKIEPLYTQQDAKKVIRKCKGLEYGEMTELYPEIKFQLRDAGHILGSSIVEIWLTEAGQCKKITFSGDLGHADIPILRNPEIIKESDWVIMETTYGDRCHRPLTETIDEIGKVIHEACADGGNILIPAFAVGRTQEILYLFAKHYSQWQLAKWNIFLDSPMAISTTDIYLKFKDLYDAETLQLMNNKSFTDILPKLHLSRTPAQSMQLNKIKSGAIIIAGSGMCTGGRIKHHLKHNIWDRACHLMIVGFQAQGTTGRALVDGAQKIRLWGETVNVAANIHTIGGLSAHADQHGLFSWYSNFKNAPKLILVHGEVKAMDGFTQFIANKNMTKTLTARYAGEINLLN
ncbi:MAG: MBL fold metallo-hydrolase [Gammaproteobacteria bacterium]|nr:MBL fold metallo-hydrolase [Gammaproteobacteria bacterium]